MRALIKASKERLQGIPSYQSLRYGYRGFITPTAVYALTGEPRWVDYQDPGLHRPLGGTTSQQRDVDVQFTVASNIYNSQENVRQAYLKALNVAVPEAYQTAQGDIGPAVYSHGRPEGDSVDPKTQVREENTHREGGGHTTTGSAVEPQQAN